MTAGRSEAESITNAFQLLLHAGAHLPHGCVHQRQSPESGQTVDRGCKVEKIPGKFNEQQRSGRPYAGSAYPEYVRVTGGRTNDFIARTMPAAIAAMQTMDPA